MNTERGSSASSACIDIWNDYSEEEVIRMPPSIQSAWRAGAGLARVETYNCPDCDTRDCPNGAAEAALLRDVETVVRECEKLAGHRLMQIAGPARRFINLLRPHIEGKGGKTL